VSYTSVVDELRQKELELRAEAFADAYDPHLPTVVLLPGGMGSRLLRSTAPYVPRTPFTNTRFYELWLDFAAALRGELREIAMTERGEDFGGHPIIASGELSSIVKKYEGVGAFFRGKANYVGLGYDWRRAPDSEFMYVRSFLRRIADKVMYRGHDDPRRRITLFAHSQGGLVAKLFVNDIVERGEDIGGWFERLVTCCTPFYGTLSHLSRYYVGEPFPNIVTGGAAVVARIVAAVKGPYLLLPAPQRVLEPRFAALGLARYPVRDAAARGTACDPFAVSARGRLPDYVVGDYLTAARLQFGQIDAPLPPGVARHIFHIRSNANNGGDRPFEMLWQVDARGDDPIRHNGADGGMHDGTVPFWSARLATTPDENIFDLSGVSHADAAENATVLEIVWALMNGRAMPVGSQSTQPGPAAGDFNRVTAILAQVQSGRRPPEDLFALSPEEFRTLTNGFTLA
jgi:hypothetical protein